MRDFVYVRDAIDVVLHFLDTPSVGGLFNCGTGQARTWKALAEATFAAMGIEPNVEFFDMPEHLQGKYQYFTQAEPAKLRNAGYVKPFTSLEEGVRDYAATYLIQHRNK